MKEREEMVKEGEGGVRERERRTHPILAPAWLLQGSCSQLSIPPLAPPPRPPC